jgi:hypothetical protein
MTTDMNANGKTNFETPIISLTDWARLDSMQDSDIDRYESPEITPEMFAEAIVQRGRKARPKPTQVTFTNDSLIIDLTDGRTLPISLTHYPRLLHATPAERNNWRLIGDGEGIRWPDLDEDISVEGLLLGRPSAESQPSFQRWLDQRAKLDCDLL